MPTEQVVLRVPHEFEATLFYGHLFPHAQRGAFDYIQTMRSRRIFDFQNWHQIENEYYKRLDSLRATFAAAVGGTFDLLIDPPSSLDWHRPYLNAFRLRLPDSRFIRFYKSTPVKSDKDKLADLRGAVDFVNPLDTEEKRATLRKYLEPVSSVLIVDDVYSAGTTGSVVVEKLLEAGLPSNASVTIAAPIKIVI